MTDEVELREKAKIIAEATGRSEEKVLEDLLDDGIVNLSNEQRKDKDLVQQLKEAAELITTVQSISQEVSENTVLNGGDNKTEVKVETTLEGDVVDRAIDSLQRKADNIKKLALTLVPIFLLITGGSMEAFGIIDIMGSDDVDDSGYETVWGCTVADADNYNPDATDDDGSCWWGNGGGGDECYDDWVWKNEAIFDHDHNGQGFNNDLRIQVDFIDLNQCNYNMNNGYFDIMVGDYQRIIEQDFSNQFTINEHYIDLPEGDYFVQIDYYTYDGSHWNGPEAWVYMESEPNCDLDLIHKDAELYLIGGNKLEVAMIIQSNNECEGDIDFMFSLYHNNSYQSTVDYGVLDAQSIEGSGEYRFTLSHDSWDNLGDGEWFLETRFRPNDTGQEICCIDTNKVEVKVESN